MKYLLLTLIIISALMVSCKSVGYENEVFSVGKGKIVNPPELQKHIRKNRFHKMYYVGSDETFHHFDHRKTTTTKYRIAKRDLDWENEFPYKTEDKILVKDQLNDF